MKIKRVQNKTNGCRRNHLDRMSDERTSKQIVQYKPKGNEVPRRIWEIKWLREVGTC
jgi:hypothetical protein